MYEPNATAFSAAKEITIARVNNSTSGADAYNGKEVADFFETVYNKLLEIAEQTNDSQN